ncbi:MAG TPA: protoporphyrinogen oxidase [Propionibacteriaceae bacterium]|nr:protoporphyrinogen oxidase [Propionibacteriaceae bacterium]
MRVAVIGGGIAGLGAARELAVGGADVVVLEAAPRCGGKLDSLTVDGVRLDSGAESVLARRPEGLQLIADLGLTDRLVHPTPAKAQVYVEGHVHELPPQAMGVPTDLDQLAEILTPQGLQRARREPDLPAPPLPGDVAIGAYVDQRFGPEVTDRLLEPLLGGVYAGDARQLSFEAVAGRLFDLARGGGSLLAHARALSASATGGPVFAGLVGGVAGLVDALLADVQRRGAEIRTGVTVRTLQRRGTGFQLSTGPVPYPVVHNVDGVVVATPASTAGRLLAPFDAEVAAELAAVPYASMALTTLVVRRVALVGSGLLVPPGQLPTIKALTHSSEKWDWVARQARAAWGQDAAVVRASVGRVGEANLLQVDDDTLLARTFAEVHRLLPGWEQAELITGQVRRWGGGLPQYLVGHRQLVDRVRRAVAAVRGLEICGAVLDGVGIAATVGTANRAATDLLDRGRRTLAQVAPTGGKPEERRAE